MLTFQRRRQGTKFVWEISRARWPGTFWTKRTGTWFEEHDAANIGDYGTVNKAGHKVFDTDAGKGGVSPVICIKKASKQLP